MGAKCNRCGYIFNPLLPEKRVIVMKGKDGRIYSACRDCLCELGTVQESEKMAILETFAEVQDGSN